MFHFESEGYYNDGTVREGPTFCVGIINEGGLAFGIKFGQCDEASLECLIRPEWCIDGIGDDAFDHFVILNGLKQPRFGKLFWEVRLGQILGNRDELVDDAK